MPPVLMTAKTNSVSSVEVVTAASSVLKSVLATKVGNDFASNYKEDVEFSSLFSYLKPFKTHKKKVRSLLKFHSDPLK